MKHVKISAFLTEAEMNRAIKLYAYCSKNDDGAPFSHLCCEQIIKPVIGRIDEALGQKNDPLYLAYAIEYALMKASGG